MVLKIDGSSAHLEGSVSVAVGFRGGHSLELHGLLAAHGIGWSLKSFQMSGRRSSVPGERSTASAGVRMPPAVVETRALLQFENFQE